MTRLLWLGLGVLGVVLLVPFDAPVTLALGVLCLLGFVAWGVAIIASPGFTREDQERTPGGPPPAAITTSRRLRGFGRRRHP